MENTTFGIPASFGRRSAAALIDLVVFLGLMMIATIPLSLTRDLDQFVASSECGPAFNEMAVSRFEFTSTLVMLGVSLAYVGGCWMFGRGRTVGKRLLGIRVVRAG